MNSSRPPRGAVRITTQKLPEQDHARHTAACGACGWTYSNTVRSDVETHKRWHQCPDPTP